MRRRRGADARREADMNHRSRRIVMACAAWTAAAVAQGAALEKPFCVEADGKAIDVEIGHAAPWLVDWDRDGTSDLLVGQFGGGKLRVYKNHGDARAPKFKDFVFAQAGGADAGVPAG
jgi:hypothetical protein